eukprot:TRINITY_DN92952_c0_g1_i1.p1 TRINITY_DN92952_c0_g1~~TRINITY_DN92952_c0_g1_i1.p1  ORF type:complete len:595 (+),score=102.14 TRINITY_DN92952_c0_g1_i1:88-1872(+)
MEAAGSGAAAAKALVSKQESRPQKIDEDLADRAELALEKGCSLRQILNFYREKKAQRIQQSTTTAEVIISTVLRETEAFACCYVDSLFMRGNGGALRGPTRFVSHAWMSKIIDTFLSILLDAAGWHRRELISGEFPNPDRPSPPLYNEGVLKAESLLKHLKPGVLDTVYWFDMMSQNQHKSVCGDCVTCSHDEAWLLAPAEHLRADPCLICKKRKYIPCGCGVANAKPGDPDYQMDLFRVIIMRVEAVVVCLDPCLNATDRIWCAAEIIESLMHSAVYFRLAQDIDPVCFKKMKAFKALVDPLEKLTASRGPDRHYLLQGIAKLEGGIPNYDTLINRALELNLGMARKLGQVRGAGLKAVQRIQRLEIDMSWAEHLMTTADLYQEGNFTNLLSVISLQLRCSRLVKLVDLQGLGQCLGQLTALTSVELDFKGCLKLRDIQPLECMGQLVNITSLKLDFSDCPELPDVSPLWRGVRQMEQLRTCKVSFASCTELTAAGVELEEGRMTNLRELDINFRRCSKLFDISTLGCLGWLYYLNVLVLNFEDCTMLGDLKVLGCLEKLANLTTIKLNFCACPNLKSLNYLICIERLQHLHL